MDFLDGNYTLVTEFILLGFPTCPELHIVQYLLFPTLYSMILMGNVGLMMLIRVDPHLQMSMHFFLSNLYFVDICYSSTIVLQMLVNFLSQNKSIPCHGCALQFYFACTFADTESFILAAMACDRYVAISLYCTRLWCLGASAYGWSSCHTLEAIWVPWCTHPLHLFWNTYTLRKPEGKETRVPQCSSQHCL